MHVFSLGYIPLRPQEQCVKEEEERQRACDMPPCDCSNCCPEEAEALWLAQPALTKENFDDALAMSESDLIRLVMTQPQPPPAPAQEVRPVAQICGPDDLILDSPTLEMLVTEMECAFNAFFYLVFPNPSDLAPNDYFGRDLAWDVAKNIDIIRQPSDLAIVLATETLPGQFECLFGAFCKWKDECPTTLSSAAIAKAAERRGSGGRPHNSNKVPQSCEGLRLSKDRAHKEKMALKVARDQAKQVACDAKAAAKLRREREKFEAEELRKSKKDTVRSRRQGSTTQPVAQKARKNPRLGAEEVIEVVTSLNTSIAKV